MSKYLVLTVEREQDPDGNWIPLAVRMKLDLAGRKIDLEDWIALSPQNREMLLGADVESPWAVDDFRERLERALHESDRAPARLLDSRKNASLGEWTNGAAAPSKVTAMLADAHSGLDWQRLDRFSRYVLCWLANKNAYQRLDTVVQDLQLPCR